MKNTTANYTINAATKEIIITKKFEKAANVINSNEYKALVTLMRDFPDFDIKVREIKKNTSKKTYSGLTIEEMRRFIAARSEKEVFLFEKVVTIAKHKKGSYAVTKKWFLNHYKDEYAKELEVLSIEKELDQFENEVNEETERRSYQDNLLHRRKKR